MESCWVGAEFADFWALLQVDQTRNSPFFWVTYKSLKIFVLDSFLSHIFYLSINLTSRAINAKQERRTKAFLIQYVDLHNDLFSGCAATQSSAAPSCPETIPAWFSFSRVEESGCTR